MTRLVSELMCPHAAARRRGCDPTINFSGESVKKITRRSTDLDFAHGCDTCYDLPPISAWRNSHGGGTSHCPTLRHRYEANITPKSRLLQMQLIFKLCKLFFSCQQTRARRASLSYSTLHFVYSRFFFLPIYRFFFRDRQKHVSVSFLAFFAGETYNVLIIRTRLTFPLSTLTR
jgi:hypothetical protein